MNNTLFIESLHRLFREHGDPVRAEGAMQYMRRQFEYYGITTPQRNILIKAFLKEHPVEGYDQLKALIQELWTDDIRDLNYVALSLLPQFIAMAQPEDIYFLEWMITTRSWWDTVDAIAPHAVYKLLTRYPHLIPETTERWISSDAIWLQRSAIIFQLLAKKKTDLLLLFDMIRRRMDSKEFFIQKAIGWSLRQYARTNPEAVIHFVDNHQLAPLSRREALKRIV